MTTPANAAGVFIYLVVMLIERGKVMEAWFLAEHARRRCDELRAQVMRDRLARIASHKARIGARQRIARMLVALGSILVEAGDRVLDDVAPAAN